MKIYCFRRPGYGLKLTVLGEYGECFDDYFMGMFEMKMLGRGLVVLVLCALTAAGGWFYALHGQNEEHQVLSREGVLMQIKQMNRLESTAFYIDTIIRTEKKGDWRRLWQDSQSGIFIVRGKVLARFGFGQVGRGQCQYCGRQGLNQPAGGGNFERRFGKYRSVRYSDRLV